MKKLVFIVIILAACDIQTVEPGFKGVAEALFINCTCDDLNTLSVNFKCGAAEIHEKTGNSWTKNFQAIPGDTISFSGGDSCNCESKLFKIYLDGILVAESKRSITKVVK